MAPVRVAGLHRCGLGSQRLSTGDSLRSLLPRLGEKRDEGLGTISKRRWTHRGNAGIRLLLSYAKNGQVGLEKERKTNQ